MNTRKWLLAALICAASFSASAETRAVIDTSAGRIYLQLDEKKAPQTVANFVRYAEKGFYNGTVFHRVIDGFMVQGGGMTADLRPKATAAPIRNEADNGLKNTTGSIAMARTAEPDSATSQFFINLADTSRRLRLQIMHPMDTGLVAGIPAFYLERLELRDSAGQPWWRLQLHEPVSENPLITLELPPQGPREFRLLGQDNNGNRIDAEVRA